jgi:hypothetical protein
MSSQLTLDATLSRVTLDNAKWLDWARAEARLICFDMGFVTTDDIRCLADRMGFQPDSPHAFGAIFKSKGWKAIGRQASTYKSNNSRWICQWKWQG